MIESWRDLHPEVFTLLQELKKRSFICDGRSDVEHSLYKGICENQSLINEALAIDDCVLLINDKYGVAGITGLTSEPNVLRRDFSSADEMLCYIALLEIYLEHSIASGTTRVVACSYDDLRMKVKTLAGDAAVIKRNGGFTSLDSINKRLKVFHNHSIITTKKEKQQIFIYPSILFCLDRDALSDKCEEIIDSWKRKKTMEELENEHEPVPAEKQSSAQQLSLFDMDASGKPDENMHFINDVFDVVV